jgi:hypothetical protein
LEGSLPLGGISVGDTNGGIELENKDKIIEVLAVVIVVGIVVVNTLVLLFFFSKHPFGAQTGRQNSFFFVSIQLFLLRLRKVMHKFMSKKPTFSRMALMRRPCRSPLQQPWWE